MYTVLESGAMKQDPAEPQCAARGYVGAMQPVTAGCILKIAVRSQFSAQTDTLEERRE